MALERITTQRVLEELKAGHTVYVLRVADMTSLTIAEWLTEEFAIEEEAPVRQEAQKIQGGGKTSAKKKLDWGKIKALHDAGWSHAKIADEMGCTVGTVDTGLSKLRKGESNGKEQSGKTNAGPEEADQRSWTGGPELAGHERDR